jgi:signal transduction histidine kinase
METSTGPTLDLHDADTLQALASHLMGRRAALLDAVRDAVTHDPEISTSRTLAARGFTDHLPEVIDAAVERLRRRAQTTQGDARPRVLAPERVPASQHGQHRWRQGYSLTEAIAEWRHLCAFLNEELETYASATPALSQRARAAAMREIAQLIADGIRASAERHAEMQRVQAAERAGELQAALEQVRALERERARTWRQAVHDLRGSLGAVSNATALLKREDAPAKVRMLSQEALNKGLGSLREMLNDLASLARLEAGQERVRLSSFNVSEVLHELCITLRPLAMNRGLALEMEGPEVLEVEGDAMKAQRIAQNLLINALKYTREGGVWISWSPDGRAPRPRWILTVKDSGPGFDAEHSAPMAAAMKSTSDEAAGAAQETAADGEANGLVLGDGIGLSIVKQLCELLSASIELKTGSDRGTTFRVVFPSSYGTR